MIHFLSKILTNTKKKKINFIKSLLVEMHVHFQYNFLLSRFGITHLFQDVANLKFKCTNLRNEIVSC